MRSRSGVDLERLRAHFVARARREETPLLAGTFERYLRAEPLTWAQLAESLGCTEAALNRIALCLPPRPERFVEDVEAIAGEEVAVDRLLALLRRMQVLAAFAEEAAAEQASSLLMAARPRAEREGR